MIFNEKLGDGYNPNEVAETVNKEFNNKLYSSYKYNVNDYKEYRPKKFESEIPYPAPIYYLTKLISCMRKEDYSTLEKWNIEGMGKAINEIEYWDKKGKLCIYVSVLLYHLLKLKVKDESKLKYVQGFYIFKVPPNTTVYNLFGIHYISGLHAFLTLENCVIDTSIQQVYDNVDDYNAYLMLGNYDNNDIDLFGYEENNKTIKKYTYKILKKNGMENQQKWIKFHDDISEKLLEFDK